MNRVQVVISKLTKKYQATIPAAVRKHLRLKAGDSVSFDIDGDRVCLRKAQAVDMAFAQSVEATLTEWSSGNDEEAYGGL